MKKRIISAAAAAVFLLAGCGSSTDKESVSLAADMSDKLTNGDYDISFTIHGDPNFEGSTIGIKRNGNDKEITDEKNGSV